MNAEIFMEVETSIDGETSSSISNTPLHQSRSQVWKHFDLINERAKCKYCTK